jgi:hypothetical protein
MSLFLFLPRSSRLARRCRPSRWRPRRFRPRLRIHPGHTAYQPTSSSGLFKSARRSGTAFLRVVAQSRKLLGRDHNDPLTQGSTRSHDTRIAYWRSSALAAPVRQPSAMDWDMGSGKISSSSFSSHRRWPAPQTRARPSALRSLGTCRCRWGLGRRHGPSRLGRPRAPSVIASWRTRQPSKWSRRV